MYIRTVSVYVVIIILYQCQYMIYVSNVGTTISNHSYLGLLKFGNPFPLLLNVPQI